jgi:SpoVK/Ycf46/Vps4 family AAA+-type ATPase
MQNPPVFLINEADQLIYSREKKASYTSKVENKIQNIILQEMENFAGILILTTNMDQMIDEAYFRRFNLKMRFNLPDYECRRQLWALHLSPNIPGYQNIDINYLAKHYEFTGGQISLVIQNACTEAIVRKGKKRELTMEDLIRYSDLELPWQKEKVNDKKSIGF